MFVFNKGLFHPNTRACPGLPIICREAADLWYLRYDSRVAVSPSSFPRGPVRAHGPGASFCAPAAASGAAILKVTPHSGSDSAAVRNHD